MAGQPGQPYYGSGWPDGLLAGLGPPGSPTPGKIRSVYSNTDSFEDISEEMYDGGGGSGVEKVTGLKTGARRANLYFVTPPPQKKKYMIVKYLVLIMLYV